MKVLDKVYANTIKENPLLEDRSPLKTGRLTTKRHSSIKFAKRRSSGTMNLSSRNSKLESEKRTLQANLDAALKELDKVEDDWSKKMQK